VSDSFSPMAYVLPARHLQRGKDFADARYAERIGVEDMAAAAGLSVAHFSREFRRAFGETPHGYLLTRRLERAASLLRLTDRSVSDICFSVGLQSLGSFTTASRARTASRPSPIAPPTRPPRTTRWCRPACCAPTPGRNAAEIEKRTARGRSSLPPMLKIATAQLWVHDQDEALAFYTEKLGMEVRVDVTMPEMGDFRWLTVGPADQPEFSIVLMAVPGPPVMDEATRTQVLELAAKGFAGTVFLTTDDVRAAYEELKGRGVEFTEEPEERPYGIDSGFRDPSGNALRLTQVRELATN
jgi:AraC-like DNA-binding protein/catechol 2,3-dioxygenase-like lactoylglutathione lyase family enzyme